jgi:hypothetical protein
VNKSEQNSILSVITKNPINKKSINKIDISKLLNYLEENRILLPFLQGIENEKLDFIELKKKINFMLKNDYVSDLDELTNFVFDFFKKINVKWMSHKHSFFIRQRGDIDVLVKPNDFEKTIDALKEIAFETVINERSKIKLTKKINSKIFTIHLHEKIIWETEFINTDDVWKHSRLLQYGTNQLRIPSPEDSIIIECVHAFFESRKIILSNILEFITIIEKEQIDWKKIFTILSSYNLISIGYVYFHSMSRLLKYNFKLDLISDEFLNMLFTGIPSNNKKIVNDILLITQKNTDLVLPLNFGIKNPALLFIKFNANKGIWPFFQSISSLSSAGFRYFLVLTKIKKL